MNTFPPEQTDRTALAVSSKNASRVTMVPWSPKRTLKPGESMRLNADYSPRRASQ
ncbi:MAG: hypothetical protein NTY38_14560 [Acidobacteria bacterium]|nr:hypothetical protein [Acidobacteriota bacterium]